MINVIKQSDYWNDKKVVKEFSEYQYPLYWKEFLNSLNGKENLKLLDLGCGGGRNSCLALELGYDVWACDVHQEMVNATKNKFSSYNITEREVNSRVIKASFTSLPFKDNDFDIVISSGVFHNGDDIEILKKGFQEAARILKTNGFLCLNIFIAGDSAEGLTQSLENNNVYFNSLGLPMILLPVTEIKKILNENNLHPYGETHIYKSKISEGERNVLRGVFQKY
jgi:ubiquinone/menaquinone biosynthesis C-methylase UbiE